MTAAEEASVVQAAYECLLGLASDGWIEVQWGWSEPCSVRQPLPNHLHSSLLRVPFLWGAIGSHIIIFLSCVAAAVHLFLLLLSFFCFYRRWLPTGAGPL